MIILSCPLLSFVFFLGVAVQAQEIPYLTEETENQESIQSQPDTPKPDAPQPDSPQPDTPRPDTHRPDVPQPETLKPDAPQPNTALAWFKRGLAFSQKGKVLDALKGFEQARALAPHWALPHLEIAVIHMMTDNDLEVIGPLLENAVELGANLPRAHYLYGMYLKETGQNREASQCFTRVLQLRPSFVDARFQLAMIMIEEGRQSEGMHHFHLLLQERPNHLGSHKTLAMLFEQSGMLEEAESHLRRITQFHPENAYHLTELARFYQRTGKQNKAEVTFQRANRLRDQNDRRKLRPLLKSRD